MNLHLKKIVDHEEPLANEAHEKFCTEYVRLDVEEGISNKRARRIKAYRFSFPETKMDADSVVNSRATVLIGKKNTSERIKALYDEIGSSVETSYSWTRFKSEDALLSIVFGDSTKNGDKLKAISELNKMRGYDAPAVVEEKDNSEDTVEGFFSKIRKNIGGE